MANNKWKFGIVLGIILVTLSWLAFTGIQQSKSYYVTVSELSTMSNAHKVRLRVAGDVVPGSIQYRSGEVDFTIAQGGHNLNVAYIGTDPLPDTFVSNAQAVAAGTLQPDGNFRATGVQAKCASKYEPKGVRKSGQPMPRTSAGSM